MLTGGVFPLWLNILLEEMEVCAHCEPARRLDIVVQAAQTQKVNNKPDTVTQGLIFMFCAQKYISGTLCPGVVEEGSSHHQKSSTVPNV